MVQYLVYLVVLLIFALGLYGTGHLFKNNNITFKRRFNLERQISKLHDSNTNKIFKKIGLNIDSKIYNLARILIILVSIGLVLVGRKNIFLILPIIAIFFLTDSKSKSKYSLFNIFINFIENINSQKKDLEIYRAVSQLKNIAVIQQDTSLGADFILNQLTNFSNITKPIFSQMLILWRVGKQEQACKHFIDAVPTKTAVEFINIISKLDYIENKELENQLMILQNQIREEKKTLKFKRQEMISNLMYVPILILAFLILINFVVITVWMDTFKQLINL